MTEMQNAKDESKETTNIVELQKQMREKLTTLHELTYKIEEEGKDYKTELATETMNFCFLYDKIPEEHHFQLTLSPIKALSLLQLKKEGLDLLTKKEDTSEGIFYKLSIGRRIDQPVEKGRIRFDITPIGTTDPKNPNMYISLRSHQAEMMYPVASFYPKDLISVQVVKNPR